jgi:hypothetical protein
MGFRTWLVLITLVPLACPARGAEAQSDATKIPLRRRSVSRTGPDGGTGAAGAGLPLPAGAVADVYRSGGRSAQDDRRRRWWPVLRIWEAGTGALSLRTGFVRYAGLDRFRPTVPRKWPAAAVAVEPAHSDRDYRARMRLVAAASGGLVRSHARRGGGAAWRGPGGLSGRRGDQPGHHGRCSPIDARRRCDDASGA